MLINIRGTASSIAPLLPPLNPNHPNQRIKVPRTAKGKLDPVNLPLFAFEYLPILGPNIKTAESAIHPPTEWTIVLPAKSINPLVLNQPVVFICPVMSSNCLSTSILFK